MAKSGLKFFNLADSYGGGGSIFEDGTYRVDASKFTLYDYNGKVPGKDGDGVCCLMWKLTPVDDKNHKPIEGKEASVQYWGAGDETEPLSRGKEIGLRSDATHDVIWKGSDFFKLMESLQKAKFDMDKYEDDGDADSFTGMVFEMGKMVDPYSKAKTGKDLDDSKKGDKKKDEPRLIVVVTGIPKQGAASKSKGGEDKEEKSKAKAKPDSDEPEDLVEAFLVSNFDTWEDEGVEKIVARALLNKTITKAHDAEKAKECIQYWNKNLATVLKAHGWSLDDDKITKG